MNENTFRKKRVVMTTIGSFGDLHPYIALALEMKRRHIQPVIATSNVYRERLEALDIEFYPLRPVMPGMDTPEGLELVDKLVDQKRGAEFLFKELLAPAVFDMYHDLSAAIQDADLLITHPIVLAGPLVAQQTGIPWISTVLSPTSLWSAFDPFVPPYPVWLHAVLKTGGPFAARQYKRAIELLTNPWLTPVYELRTQLGLPPGAHPLFEGQYAPELNLALFSSVLCKPQSDWPANTVITGFPYYDKKDNAPIDPTLLRFLNSGPAPIVFTLGSAAVHLAGDFFRESIAAAKLLNRRAVLLLGNDRNQLNEPLPESMIAVNYAPYGDLFPRAAAVVHQGGVGTTGQGLRAGIPTLIVPFAHDQFDNAARVARLGVSRTISRKSYRAQRVARELQELLETPLYARSAKRIGREVRCENSAVQAVDLIVGHGFQMRKVA